MSNTQLVKRNLSDCTLLQLATKLNNLLSKMGDKEYQKKILGLVAQSLE